MSNPSYTTQNDLLLVNLMKFYRTTYVNEPDTFNPNNNLDKMLRIVTGDSKISLRFCDWFATNYAKKHYTGYTIEGGNEDTDSITEENVSKYYRRFKVYDDYKLKLKD